jgi:hypothetical protein
MNIWTITSADVGRCPRRSLSPRHYREDGKCRCATSVGDRVRLIRTTDPLTVLRRGALGTVTFIDDVGTVHIRCDDGSYLGLIPGIDRWEAITGD